MDDIHFILDRQCSIGNEFLAALRDTVVQKNRMLFRRNMERLGEIMAYEVSKSLRYEPHQLETPLGQTTVSKLADYPVLITILRAGIPFYQGFLNVFDQADSGFVGAYRNEDTPSVTVSVDYVSIPPVDGRVVILIDPMLATGKSLVHAQRMLLEKGRPSHLHVVSVVAAPEGIRFLKDNLALPWSLWTCAVDEKLNPSFYIVPGLGDAGDLSFGPKH